MDYDTYIAYKWYKDKITPKNENDFDYMPMIVYNYLVKNYFDCDGLIEKGSAIDVNTLEQNPYK